LYKRNFKLKKKKLYYLLGAGGIGMSSIAQYLKAKGHDVFGFDNNYSVVTKLLEDKGIIMNYGNSIKSIQKINTNDKKFGK